MVDTGEIYHLQFFLLSQSVESILYHHKYDTNPCPHRSRASDLVNQLRAETVSHISEITSSIISISTNGNLVTWHEWVEHNINLTLRY